MFELLFVKYHGLFVFRGRIWVFFFRLLNFGYTWLPRFQDGGALPGCGCLRVWPCFHKFNDIYSYVKVFWGRVLLFFVHPFVLFDRGRGRIQDGGA